MIDTIRPLLISVVVVAAYLLYGCSTVRAIADPVPTVITDNLGTPAVEDDRIITIQMKSDGHVKYELTKDGYALEIDNKGAKSFTRSIAEKVIEKTEVVFAPGVDSVGSTD